jgi:predicted dinucleotide-binding enzyme
LIGEVRICFVGVALVVEENPQDNQEEEEEEEEEDDDEGIEVEDCEEAAEGSVVVISVPIGVTPANEVKKDFVKEEFC